MRHDERGGRARGELPLEPLDRVDREVVGRLVEQQHVRALQQRGGERDPLALAARQAGGQPGQQRLDVEAGAETAHLCLEAPRVGAVHRRRGAAEPLGGGGRVPALRRELRLLGGGAVLSERGDRRRVRLVHEVGRRLVLVEGRLLLDEGEVHTASALHLARVRRVRSRQHPQQRALAGAIHADERHLGATRERQVNVLEAVRVAIVREREAAAGQKDDAARVGLLHRRRRRAHGGEEVEDCAAHGDLKPRRFVASATKVEVSGAFEQIRPTIGAGHAG